MVVLFMLPGRNILASVKKSAKREINACNSFSVMVLFILPSREELVSKAIRKRQTTENKLQSASDKNFKSFFKKVLTRFKSCCILNELRPKDAGLRKKLLNLPNQILTIKQKCNPEYILMNLFRTFQECSKGVGRCPRTTK